MATAKNKTNSQVETAPETIATEIDLEDAIADDLLDSIDWQRVKALMMQKAKAKFFAWLTSGGDRPVNISAFPELQALPSGDEERAA
jgi:hypothetical protein